MYLVFGESCFWSHACFPTNVPLNRTDSEQKLSAYEFNFKIYNFFMLGDHVPRPPTPQEGPIQVYLWRSHKILCKTI